MGLLKLLRLTLFLVLEGKKHQIILQTVPEYMEQIKLVNAKAADVYRYMNFDQIPEFVEQAATVEM